MSLSTLEEQSSILRSFYLCYNRVDDMNSALFLSSALKLHPRMDLDMSFCDLGHDPEILSAILQLDVKAIKLSQKQY